MGGESVGDGPQRGFDHWVSFAGQGSYLPSEASLNVNGVNVPQRGYITDELTDYALQWLESRDRQRLSHKAVHSEFIPAERHKGRYAKQPFTRPKTWDAAPGKTPTQHALRGDRYKYIRYQGVWDIDELFDLQAEPLEANNLIFSSGHEGIVEKLNKQLFEMLEATDGLSMPLSPDAGQVQRLRRRDKAKSAEFPPQFTVPPK